MPYLNINKKYALVILIFFSLLLLMSCSSNEDINSIESPHNSLEYQQTNTMVKSRVITRASTFETTLYPLLKNHCGECHGSAGSIVPQFANNDKNLALADIDAFSLVNLSSPDTSKIVKKLSDQLHNCWNNCDENSLTLGQAIKDWKAAFSQSGQTQYQTSCESCHGAQGNGNITIPPIRASLSQEELIVLISTTMPPADPTLCTGVCATEVAAYISQGFTSAITVTNLHNPLASLPQGAEQMSALCAELKGITRDDLINDVFCAQPAPTINSLGDLQAQLKLTIDPNFSPDFTPFTLLTHSTSLIARYVSSINPRAIFFSFGINRPSASTPDILAMGFARGEQFVELFTMDRTTGDLFFYLLVFEQACNINNQCGNSDLLTRNVELNWTNYTIYSQTDLQNTVFDCLHCHQPEGPGTKSIPRMQEINEPWTHYIAQWTEGGQTLFDDFTLAHRSSEFYANIPLTLVGMSDPFLLELFIAEIMGIPAFTAPTPTPAPPSGTLPVPVPSPLPWKVGTQPNQFDSKNIEQEVKNFNPMQPILNMPPGQSATWDIIYEASVRGEFIPVPYHDVKVTDELKLKSMGDKLDQYTNGLLPVADLPDIRQVFLDEAARDMGFQVKAGLDGAGIITEACAQCHNSKLDQTISRARFNIDLTKMSDLNGGYLSGIQRDEVILAAISRLRMDGNDIRKMPPELFKHLTPTEIDLAATYFCAEMNVPASLCAN